MTCDGRESVPLRCHHDSGTTVISSCFSHTSDIKKVINTEDMVNRQACRDTLCLT